MDVYRALKPLAPAFVRLQDLWGDRPDALVWGVTDEARRAVGQWRSSMMPAVSLEPEQEELLKTLVEASRNVPRDQRQEFHCLSDLNGDQILHPGIPNRKMPVYKGDIGTLASEGLLNMTGTRSFDLSSQGFRLYGELQHRSGAPAQQIEAELKRYLDSDAFQRSCAAPRARRPEGRHPAYVGGRSPGGVSGHHRHVRDRPCIELIARSGRPGWCTSSSPPTSTQGAGAGGSEGASSMPGRQGRSSSVPRIAGTWCRACSARLTSRLTFRV